MAGAEPQIANMERVFSVPRFEVDPTVYFKVTDNWVELTLRYLVDPKKRRAASSFILGRSLPPDPATQGHCDWLQYHEPDTGKS